MGWWVKASECLSGRVGSETCMIDRRPGGLAISPERWRMRKQHEGPDGFRLHHGRRTEFLAAKVNGAAPSIQKASTEYVATFII